MPVALQIREVPDHVRDVLTAEAHRRGQSVQAYLLSLVEREARLLDNAAAFAHTRNLRISIPDIGDVVDAIREGREHGFEVDRSSLQ